MESGKFYNKENKSDFSESSETLNRWAIFDFSVLTIVTLLVLAFLYPDNSDVFFLLSLPYLISAILSKSDNSAVYPVTLVIAVISILFGLLNGYFLISLKEWVMFFTKGYSLRFLELSYLILITGYIGMGYFSVRKYFSKQLV
ncbi:hypothetical protein E3V55_02290 [Candidatus Marinimicrobia bacterium MT.SAG.3]|nr:hypothetical protein E3V55_02290 [Candidatus Marinimicrobia bacterium MT.SAG.3]